jgi:hypothetical protein
MGKTFTLVQQFGNPTFNSLTVSGSIRFTGDLVVTGGVTGTSFSGAGTGLTGTASSLSIGGNAATATTATTATTTTGNAGSVTYLPSRTDVAAYPILWGAAYTNTIGTIAYSCAAVTIQSSTGTINATAASLSGNLTVSTGNVTGGGIVLADDGDIVDLNDGFCAMRFSNGVRVHAGSRTGAVVHTLHSNGTFTATGNVTAFSDARVKTNIKTIDNALLKVLALRGVTYNRTDLEDKSEQIGVIAQEVKEILPQVVQENDGHYSVAYGNIVGVLIEAIKEQQAQIEELKSRL